MTTTTNITAWIARCPYCSKVERVEAATVYERNRTYSICECMKAPGFSYGTKVRLVSFRAIKATYKAEVVCTATCTGAHGDVCVCSCRGENHAKAIQRRGILL